MSEIFDQQIRQRIDVGLDADFLVAAGQFVDEEDQTAGACQEFFAGAALEPAQGFFVNLARQDACLQQLVRRVEVQVVGRHDRAQRGIRVGLNDLVRHAELVAQLAVGAGLIEHAQCAFPEATPDRQDGVILRKPGDVVLTMTQGRAGQMPGDLAEVGLHDLLDRRGGLGLLGQNHLADDGVDVGIGKLDADREAAFKLLEVGGAGHGGLAGTDEQQLAANTLADGLDGFLDVDRTLAIAADILLHLIQHDQGQRQLFVPGEGLLDGLQHVVAGDILNVGIEVVERLDAGGGRGKQIGLELDQRGMQPFGDVEVVEFFLPVVAVLFDMGFDGVEQPFLP